MILTTLCYLEKEDSYLMLHRVKKKKDVNKDKWIGIGGKFEKDESPEECLRREAREETGVEHIKPLSTAIASLDILPVWGHVKRGEWVPSHQHLNVTYLLTADDRDPLHFREGENTKVGWLPAEGLLAYTNEWEMDGIYTKLLARTRTYIKF